jgi:glycosyltransferase involved in cell wall biosynthesis
MEPPVISIIIPTRNRADLLSESLGSVLVQTHPTSEIIIVDDGSREDSRQQVRQWVQGDGRIHLHFLSQARGASFARNYGLEKATGEFILFLDDDDLIKPAMLASCLNHFSPDVDVVTCRSEFFFSQSRVPKDHPIYFLLTDNKLRDRKPGKWLRRLLPDEAKQLEKHPFHAILEICPPVHSSLIRRDAIGDIRFPESLTLGEDWYFWLCLAFKGVRFRYNPHVYASIRVHDANRAKGDRYHAENILKFHKMVKQSGMLTDSKAMFLNHSHLFITYSKAKGWPSLQYLLPMLKYPGLLPKYCLAYLARLMGAF